jgi:hypothetical protein
MPLDPVSRQIAEQQTLQAIFPTIAECELFRSTLKEFKDASGEVRACTDEGSPQYAASAILDTMLYHMVMSVADYHCARTVFEVLGAFHAIHQQEEDSA